MRSVGLELETVDPVWRSRRVSRDLNASEARDIDHHVAELFEELRGFHLKASASSISSSSSSLETKTTATTADATATARRETSSSSVTSRAPKNLPPSGAAAFSASTAEKEATGLSIISSSRRDEYYYHRRKGADAAAETRGTKRAAGSSSSEKARRSGSPQRRATPQLRRRLRRPRPQSVSATVVVVDEVGRRHAIHRFENPEHAARALRTLEAFLARESAPGDPATVTLRYDESKLDDLLVAIAFAVFLYLACVEATFERVEMGRIVRVSRRSGLGVRVFEFHCLSDHVDAVHVVELGTTHDGVGPSRASPRFGLCLLLDPPTGAVGSSSSSSTPAASESLFASDARATRHRNDSDDVVSDDVSDDLTEEDEEDGEEDAGGRSNDRDDNSDSDDADDGGEAAGGRRRRREQPYGNRRTPAGAASFAPGGGAVVVAQSSSSSSSSRRTTNRTTRRRLWRVLARRARRACARFWPTWCPVLPSFAFFASGRRRHSSQRSLFFKKNPQPVVSPRIALSFGDAFGDSAGLKRVAEAANAALRDLARRADDADATKAHRGGQGPTTSTPLCVVCRVKPRDTVLVPCQHLHVCRRCAVHLRDCPICRRRIRDRRRVYM